jgi:hypothetical protein
LISQEDWNAVASTAPLDMAEMDELVTQSVAAWEDYDAKKKISTEALNKAEAIDAKILEALRQAGKSKYFVDGVGTISKVAKMIVRVPSSASAKKEFFRYLRTLGEDVLFAMTTVNSNTLNAWYNTKLEEASSKGLLNFSVPGIEEPTTRESLRFLKDKKATRSENNG